MSKITLTPLALTDLSIKYARRREGNKITHYRMSYVEAMLNRQDPRALLSNFIWQNEPDAEIEFVASPTSSTLEPATGVLDNEPKIKAALEKQYIKSQLYQRMDLIVENKWRILEGKTAPYWNGLVAPLNNLLRKLQMRLVPVDLEEEYLEEITPNSPWGARWEFRLQSQKKLIQVPTLKEFTSEEYKRTVLPCLYHSVAYEEGDEARAEQILLDDLRIYQDHDAIIGHLAMPTRMALGDTIGSGKRRYVLFCFPFVDLYKAPGYEPMQNPWRNNPFSGTRTWGKEGDISFIPELSVEAKYDIEVVDVLPGRYDAHLREVHQSYKDSLPYVEKAVQNTQKKIEAAKVKG